MRGFFSKIRQLICRIPQNARRKIIQLAAFGFTNFRLDHLGKGTIYQGKWKEFCVPGLNCYSCPAANFSCPVGAFQAVSSSRQFGFGFLAAGIVLAFGVILGRAVCGYLCPFGLLQDLLGLIPLPKLRLRRKWKYLTYLKYVILAVFVILLPAVIVDFTGLGRPWFCEYICPAGTLSGLLLLFSNDALSGMIGPVFWIKAGILVVIMILCLFIFRFFCKVLCPLGAIYGLLNKISLYHLEVDREKCTDCGKCEEICHMDIHPAKELRSTECILCGRCTAHCAAGALKMKWKSGKGGRA